MIEKYLLEPTYTKKNGLWLLNVDTPNLPESFNIFERNVVFIPSGEFGGNHKHPRSEAFVGVGEDLQLIWQDDAGKRHVEKMNQGSGLQLFVVRSLTPHVVVNNGDKPAVLIEFADDKQHGVEPADLLNN